MSTRLSFVLFSALLSHGGGRETWLNNVLPELLKRHEYDYIDVYFTSDATTDGKPRISNFAVERVNFIETHLPVCTNKFQSIRRIILFCWNVFGHLRSRPSDKHFVVAIGTFYEGAVLTLLKALSRRPPLLVIWIRGVWSKEINHRHGRLIQRLICTAEKLFVRCADRIISNGHDTKGFYEALLGRHVEAIPNALDANKYQRSLREAFSSGVITISFIGRLSEEKGLRAYLRAIEVYLQNLPARGLSFEIVGDGPLRYMVEEFVAANAHIVRYLGPIANEEMPAYLETIDAGVCLTYSKQSGGGGVSNGMLELIGAGRLVIAWDSLIYKQVLNDSQALFVTESDIGQLADCFVSLGINPTAMREKVTRSKDVLPSFSLESHVQHFVSYLRHQPIDACP